MSELTFIQDQEASTSHQNVFFAQVHPSVPEAKLVLIQYLGTGETTNVTLIGIRQEDTTGTNILWRTSYPSLEVAMGEAISIHNLATEVIEKYGTGEEGALGFYTDNPEIAMEVIVAGLEENYLNSHRN
jgi:hypothetical protein